VLGALDGGRAELPEDGMVDDPVLAGALRVAEELGRLLPAWQRAPLQASPAARAGGHDLVPVATGMRCSGAAPGGRVTERLELLGRLVAPARCRAGAGRGGARELLAVAPFEVANGVVARAAARLTGLSTGWTRRARGAGGRAPARPRSTGRQPPGSPPAPDGLGRWVLHCCAAWSWAAGSGGHRRGQRLSRQAGIRPGIRPPTRVGGPGHESSGAGHEFAART